MPVSKLDTFQKLVGEFLPYETATVNLTISAPLDVVCGSGLRTIRPMSVRRESRRPWRGAERPRRRNKVEDIIFLGGFFSSLILFC